MASRTAKTKEQAEELFAGGRLSEALAAYETIALKGGTEPRVHLRMGDISRKLGDTAAAVKHYTDASEGFARLGFVIKAIAVLRLILHIDPEEQHARARITELCAVEGGAHGVDDKGAQAPKEEAEARKLPRAPLFSDFTEEEFSSVIREVRVKGLEEAEMLFSAGDHGGSIFFVAEGLLDVVYPGDDGGELVLAELKHGDVFGEFGFFSNSLRSAGVRARTRTEVLELTRADLDGLIKAHPRIRAVLFEFYKARVVDRLMALSSVFCPLSATERKEMLKGLTPVELKAGATVVREGDPGEVMYLIKEGRVSVRAGRDEKGGSAPVEVAGLAEGDFFGEIALATERPRVASVTALTDVSLVEFSRKAVREAARAHPEIKDILKRVIKERVNETLRAERARGALV